MNPLKHKLANEWMRQDDATPEEALDTWNTMEAEFKLNRAVAQEPRTMAHGGRIIGKPGGLVEPGVEYYGNKVKVDVAAETTSKFRNDISNWTENWINKNAYKYKLRDFEKFKKALSKAWLKESKNKKYKIPGVGTTKARILTKNGLPNIATTKSVQPFNMLGFEMPGGVSTEMTGSAQRNFFSKIFYKKHLNKNTDLAKSFNSYLDYMVADKRGTNQSAHSKIVRNLMKKSGVDDPLKLINDDVVYLLSNDSGLGGKARYELFTDTFGKKYTAYQDKMTTAQGSWNKAQKIIKAKTGIDIKKQLRVENEALRKLFKVTELPAELKYAGDHIFGVSQAAQTNNKKFMKAAIDNLVGMTATQNRFLGMGVFEKERGKLVNKINKAIGSDKAKFVKELNTLMGDTYSSSFPKNTNFYTLDKGKLNINPNLKKLSQGERFMGWATEISKKPTKILKETFTDTGARKAILDFKKGNEKTLVKFFKDAGIDCIKGAGGQCNSIADFNKGYNKLVQEGAEGSKAAISKLDNFTKAMRGFKGAAKWTGYGLLAEAGFMIPFAVGDYAAGESWKRILGNATDYGFGPILGQSEQEEFIAALPEGSKAVEGEKVLELGERLTGMGEQKVNPGYGRVGFEEKAPEQRQKVYTDILEDYNLNLQPFMKGPAGQFLDESIWTQAHEDAADTRAQIAKEKLERLQKRRDEGTIAQEDWMVGGDTRGYASGGIMSVKKK